MSKCIVELRPNRFGSEGTDEPEAFLGITEDFRGKVVAKRAAAHEFHNETEARRVLNRMRDEFFDRYYPTTVEAE